MSNDEQTYRIGSSDAEPRKLTSMDDVLRQLDRVVDPIPLELYEEGFDRLMAWMAEDVPPEPIPATETPGDANTSGSAKVLVVGGAQAGTSEFVRQLSEIAPITTDPLGDERGSPVPEGRVEFGRMTISEDIVLYLFTPQGPGLTAWDWLARGAIGAVVLADTQRLSDCFDALNYLETNGMPYVVAINEEEGAIEYSETAVRAALNVSANIPVMFGDTRRQTSAREVLITLVSHALEQSLARRRRAAPVAVDSSELSEELTALVLLTQLEGLLR
ncbi:GTP-binding protein [Streptomyces sp. NPDC052236]|uniref:GTP-binding protein n=1 Tax=Streptomyces sp. NPDC052236 TaxID=3365686 RepID=UPI0037D62F27